MSKKCIYFHKNNIMFKQTVEVSWDTEAMKANKILCSKEIKDKAYNWLPLVTDVSSSPIRLHKSLSIFNVKDSNGISVKDLWDILKSKTDINMLPYGSFDLVYLKNLNSKQLNYALCNMAFFDIYHNPDKDTPTASKALVALQMLYNQGKIDYIEDMHKFLHWYYANCSCPIEWNEAYN